jgi:hypothetical protein
MLVSFGHRCGPHIIKTTEAEPKDQVGLIGVCQAILWLGKDKSFPEYSPLVALSV